MLHFFSLYYSIVIFQISNILYKCFVISNIDLKKKNNRKDTKHTLFGQAYPLSAHQLSSIGDALRKNWWYKCEAGRFAHVNEIVKKAALGVSANWAWAIGEWLTISLLDQKVIQDKLKRLYKKGLIVSRNKRNLTKLNEFKIEMNKVFDICSCMCPSPSCFQVNCIAKNYDELHLACKCNVKVRTLKIPCLLDQSGARKTIISDIDRDVSKMWARAAARDEAMEVAVEIQKGQAGFRQEQVQLDFSDDSADDAGNNDKSKLDEDYVETTSMSDNSSK